MFLRKVILLAVMVTFLIPITSCCLWADISIDLEKYYRYEYNIARAHPCDTAGVQGNSGVSWWDTFIITNNSDVILESITLVDDIHGVINLPTDSLLPGEIAEVTIGPFAIFEGQQTSSATVTGYYNGVPYTNTVTISYPDIQAAPPIPVQEPKEPEPEPYPGE